MKKTLLILSAIVNSLIVFSQTAGTNGIIAQYPFSGNANDVTGNGNNGYVIGATLTTDRFGNANSAYSFDASSGNYINIPAGNFVNNNYSVSLWAYLYTLPQSGNRYIILSIGSSGGDQFININNNYSASIDGWSCGGYNNGGAQSSLSQNVSSPLNTWCHLVMVRSNNAMKYYVNGTLVDQDNSLNSSITPNYGTGNAVANIGARFNSTLFFNGKIDDLIVYNRALSDNEVIGLYNTEFTGITKKNDFEPSIGPNPVIDNRITISGCKKSVFSLCDIQGRELMKSMIKSDNENIQIPQINSGVYFIRITNDKDNLLKKIIIE